MFPIDAEALLHRYSQAPCCKRMFARGCMKEKN
jgi:hypothetical protein